MREKKRKKEPKMNKNEIYSKIERCVDDLKQKDSEESNKHRWALLEIGKEEYLICDICGRSMHNETAHINIPNEYHKVLCENCWNETP
jgi:hypothetical protein